MAQDCTPGSRRDGLHKLTTGLVREFGTIVLEDLNVSGMPRNRCLARHIADVGMRELRQQTCHKSVWGGARLVIAGRWYPSSKTCSDCGAVKAGLPLRVRVYNCDVCGFVLDRDLNAARDLGHGRANATPQGDSYRAERADVRSRLR